MEPLPKGEELSLDEIAIMVVFVPDAESVDPGEDLLLDNQTHGEHLTSLVRRLLWSQLGRTFATTRDNWVTIRVISLKELIGVAITEHSRDFVIAMLTSRTFSCSTTAWKWHQIASAISLAHRCGIVAESPFPQLV
jgi:hypothetical protein